MSSEYRSLEKGTVIFFCPTPALRADPPPNGEGWFPLTDQWEELGMGIGLLEPPWGFSNHSRPHPRAARGPSPKWGGMVSIDGSMGRIGKCN